MTPFTLFGIIDIETNILDIGSLHETEEASLRYFNRLYIWDHEEMLQSGRYKCIKVNISEEQTIQEQLEPKIDEVLKILKELKEEVKIENRLSPNSFYYKGPAFIK